MRLYGEYLAARETRPPILLRRLSSTFGRPRDAHVDWRFVNEACRFRDRVVSSMPSGPIANVSNAHRSFRTHYSPTLLTPSSAPLKLDPEVYCRPKCDESSAVHPLWMRPILQEPRSSNCQDVCNKRLISAA